MNEAFRQYGIDWGIPCVGRVFKGILTFRPRIVLNSQFPAAHPSADMEGVLHRRKNLMRPFVGDGMAEYQPHVAV